MEEIENSMDEREGLNTKSALIENDEDKFNNENIMEKSE